MIYYPGFIFGDSLGSIAQALGVAKLYNHHPIFILYFENVLITRNFYKGYYIWLCGVYDCTDDLYSIVPWISDMLD